MDLSVLAHVDVILGFAILILTIFYRFEFPPVLGFLVTGILIGPYGLGILNGGHDLVDLNSELGMIFLLFTIGVDLSLGDLWKMKKDVMMGGTLHLVFTTILIFIACSALGFGHATSIFIGCILLSHSSTAVVLKVLQDRNEVFTPHGKTSLAVLIFQDLTIVPMILMTPMLAGNSVSFDGALSSIFLKGSLIILVFILSAKVVVPWIFYHVGRTGSKQLFMVSVIFICLSAAVFTYSIGLSLALGAFLAGTVISGSSYNHQAMGNILPIKDMFMSFFFVSVGMLLDINYLIDNLPVLILGTIVILILKSIAGVVTTFLLGYPLRTTILTGIALSQIGELSFVLSSLGLEYYLLTAETYQAILAVSILTMGVTPFLIAASYKPADFIVKKASETIFGMKLVRGLSGYIEEEKDVEPEIKDHVIIVGFGFSGKTISKAAKAAGIPYVILETNPEIIKQEKGKGEKIKYGDATLETVLEYAGIKYARIIVVGISDAEATRKIVERAKELNPSICVIAKVRDLQEMKKLNALGADEIIPEQYETSVEIFVRMLEKYLVPQEDIEKLVNNIRANGYRMMRKLSVENTVTNSGFNIKEGLRDIDIQVLKVGNGSIFEGKTLADLEIRKKYGVTVLSIQRGSETVYTPCGDFFLKAKDACVLLGKAENLINVRKLFEGVHR
ncbi:cation:proton antiporter [Methanosarcina hadiensis]|jgi:CPA2 family monovalent cation:H+ antiporter-2|uniref:cation:proton antiporter domain-containing protein n=1 Tax=Methanosarcina hadiensis TaxID=3078083 RepID=UPI003977AA0D